MSFRVAYEHERVRRSAHVATTVIKGNYLPIARSMVEGKTRAARGGYAPRQATRTVVKGNYRQTGRSEARGRLLNSLDYFEHRPDEGGSRASRAVFGEDGTLDHAEATEIIETSEGEFGYRLVLSPGREMDAGELEMWTRGVMEHLTEEGTVSNWVGVAHPDQSDHPHAHVIAFSERKFEVEDFRALRFAGDLEAERVLEVAWTRRLESSPEVTQWTSSSRTGGVDELAASASEPLERRLETDPEDDLSF